MLEVLKPKQYAFASYQYFKMFFFSIVSIKIRLGECIYLLIRPQTYNIYFIMHIIRFLVRKCNSHWWRRETGSCDWLWGQEHQNESQTRSRATIKNWNSFLLVPSSLAIPWFFMLKPDYLFIICLFILVKMYSVTMFWKTSLCFFKFY